MSRRPRQGLHFIITDPSSNESRSETLREVRSHAGRWTWQQIRGYQNREGAGNENGETSNTDISSGHESESITPNDLDDELSPPGLKASPISNSLSPGLVPAVASSASSVLTPGYVGEQSRARKPSTVSLNSQPPPSWDTDHPEEDPNTSSSWSLSSQHSGPVHGVGASILDPFQAQVPSALSLELVSINDKYALSVVWPGLMPGSSSIGGNHVGVHAWFSHSLSHSALRSSMVFGSYSHRRTQTLAKGRGQFSDKESKEMMISQMDSISKLNAVIRDATDAVSDAMILSVLCLANNDSPAWHESKKSPFQAPLRSLQWVDVYGSLSPNPIHQAGLAQLVYLRGGLEKIELPGLGAIISFSSILAASRSLSRPHFPFIPLQDGAQPTLQHIIDTRYPTTYYDPDPSLALHITREMYDIVRAACAYVSLIEAHQEGMPMMIDMTALCDHRNLLQWYIMSLAPASQLGPVVHQFCQIYECCRLALVIFAVGVVFPLPAETAPLLKLARMLQLELQSYEDGIAARWPPEVANAHWWCVVLGGIAANGSQEQAWFVSELRRIAVAQAISSWGEVQNILKSVLWFDSACNPAGRELWMDAMRVVDPC